MFHPTVKQSTLLVVETVVDHSVADSPQKTEILNVTGQNQTLVATCHLPQNPVSSNFIEKLILLILLK